MFVLKINRSISIRTVPVRISQILYYSDDKKKSDESNKKTENDESKKDESKKSAIDRLNDLLTSMQTDDNSSLVKSISIPKAGGRKHQKKLKSQEQQEERPKDIIEAAKNVADLIGGEKQTESELLSKLLNHVGKTDEIDRKLQTNAENNLNLNELIGGMKIDRTKKPKEVQTRGQYVRQTLSASQEQKSGSQQNSRRVPRSSEDSPTSVRSTNLFGSQPLGIFKGNSPEIDTPDPLKTWSYLEQRELKLSITHPPTNYFQKMALWTEEGKLWKFPIDNEQGLEDEAKVYFAEHIFLEKHLEDWCPTRGPIRHFMELVTVGLSKNPYITIQDKKEHILWYRDYFEQKKDILRDAIQQQGDESKTGEKELEK